MPLIGMLWLPITSSKVQLGSQFIERCLLINKEVNQNHQLKFRTGGFDLIDLGLKA